MQRRYITAWIREHFASAVNWNRASRNCIQRSFPLLCRSKTDSSVFSVEDETRIFEKRRETSVLYDESDDLHTAGVSLMLPDRVIGLRNDTYFHKYLAGHPSVRHSPFADGNTIHPFLILEAKSANHYSRFRSTEDLSA